MYYPPESRVTSLTLIKRERLLPVQGEVLVRVGDKVEPSDIVAQAALPKDFYVVEAARVLSVEDEELSDYMLKEVGDFLRADEIIAAKGGVLGLFPPRKCPSPVDGRLVSRKGGRLLIESYLTPFELKAHLKGQVTNLMSNYGVVIQTVGALIQGVWGIGEEASGVLKMVVDDPQQPLEPEAIDASCHRAIIVGGSSAPREALLKAKERQVQGVIVGGLDASLRELSSALPFPVIATEGIGEIPMALMIFEILSSNAEREVSISAKTQLRWGRIRPEIVIPSQTDEAPPPQPSPNARLEIGVWIRITRQPRLGVVGRVVALPPEARIIDSGAKLRGAEVELEGGEKVFVPWANLELIR